MMFYSLRTLALVMLLALVSLPVYADDLDSLIKEADTARAAFDEEAASGHRIADEEHSCRAGTGLRVVRVGEGPPLGVQLAFAEARPEAHVRIDGEVLRDLLAAESEVFELGGNPVPVPGIVKAQEQLH